MMKTISIYAFTCLCGMIFVTANEQGNKSCNYRTYVQIQLIYNSFTFLKCKNTYYKTDLWLCFSFFFFRFLTTCCRNDENFNIHNNDDTIKKICKGLFAYILALCYIVLIYLLSRY